MICSEPLIVPAGIVSPLSDTNPKAVICSEPLSKPLGLEVISSYDTEPDDVK